MVDMVRWSVQQHGKHELVIIDPELLCGFDAWVHSRQSAAQHVPRASVFCMKHAPGLILRKKTLKLRYSVMLGLASLLRAILCVATRIEMSGMLFSES